MAVIQLSSATFSVDETSGVVNITVVRNGNLGNQATIQYTTLIGTAEDVLDYTGNLNGTLTFNPGESLKTIQVPIIDDNVAELNETFALAIGDITNNYVAPGLLPDQLGGPRTGTITIRDDDVSDQDKVEFTSLNFVTQENSQQAILTITKKPSDTEATIDFSTEDDYAKSVTTKPEYKDYQATTGTLTFAQGETTKTVTISIVNDNLSEINENLNVSLTNPVGTTLGLKNTATVTINNDDSLPGVFSKEILTTGLTKPTGFAWGADGNIYIAESGGIIKIFNQNTNTLLPTPFIDMSNLVNIGGQRGLLSFTIDPQFPAKPYFYVGYTYESPEQVATDGPDSEKPRKNRLVRITANAATNYTTAVPSSELILMEVPESFNAHASAGIAFGQDGSLFWAHGDGALLASVFTDPAKLEDLNYPFGKLFRIDPATGKGYADNPFYDGNPDTYRSKVYSYGFRNPFRITINPTTGEPYIGDVGWDAWEEVNTGRGKNFGWPLYGGANDRNERTPAYAIDPTLQELYNSTEATPPIYARNHNDNFLSIIMGAFYTADVYPSIFKNSLFIGNFNGKTLEALNFDTTGTKVENSILVSNNLDAMPTQILLGPDGYLYAVDYNYTTSGASSLIRWVFDQTPPKITISDVSVLEGHTGTTRVPFSVTLDKAFTSNVIIKYLLADQTALSASDYQNISGIITFSPGTTLQTIQVTVIGDTILENNETFSLRLRDPINATFTRSAAIGTIINDDTPPRITISDTSVTEGNMANTLARFLVSLDSPSGRTTIVNFSTQDQSALSGADYQGTSGQVTFTSGTTVQTIQIPVIGDTLFERNETFLLRLRLDNLLNATFTRSVAIGTIFNNDPPPLIRISDASVLESNTGTTAQFVVSLNTPSGRITTVNYATSDQTALSSSDYQATSGQITFTPGITLNTIEVAITGDSLFEADETFVVNLSDPLEATIAKGSGEGTIANDDSQAQISINDVSLIEGNTNTIAQFVVSLDSTSDQTVTVNYATSDQTALSSSDYQATSGQITFTPGITLNTIEVAITGDSLFEADETFVVNLSDPLEATIAKGSGEGTIANDDSQAQISINDVSLIEGNTNTIAQFVVSLDSTSDQTVTVNYATSDQTALRLTDYLATAGQISFTPGTTVQTIQIAVISDNLSEPSETFGVSLSEPVKGIIIKNTGVGTIIDDDTPPRITISDTSVIEGNTGTTTAQFRVALDSMFSQPIILNYSTSDQTASSLTDYLVSAGRITFAPGSTVENIEVPITTDTVFESNETFLIRLRLNNSLNGTFTRSAAIGTIINDDLPPRITISDTSVLEGNTGTTAARFLVTLDSASGRTVTVNYSTSDQNASSLTDYQATSGQITFAPGTSSQTIEISVTGDTLIESNESFLVRLRDPVNSTFARSAALGRILNDDVTNASIPLPQPKSLIPSSLTKSSQLISPINESLINIPNLTAQANLLVTDF